MMTMQATRLSAVLLGAVIAISAATITINEKVRYQTIEGMGAFAETPSDGPGSNWEKPAMQTFIHDDLGVTMVRIQIDGPGEFETRNDNADPAVTDLTKFNTAGNIMGAINAINGLKKYPDIKFIASLWSPPAWMKDNNSVAGGGSLLPTMRAELAEFLATWVKVIKQKTGVEIYALSIQNEPNFSEWYTSCVYQPADYVATLKVVGARFKKDSLPTRFFGAEHMAWAFGNSGDFISSLRADAEARQYMYAWAVHGYEDGIKADVNSYAQVTATDKQLWMTETSGFGTDFSGAQDLADAIFKALKLAKMSAWVWWCLDGDKGAEALLDNSAIQHTARSAVSKNFYRWIRPGAVQIDCNSSDATLQSIAFYHMAQFTLATVFVNRGGSKTITLSGNQLPATLHKYTTSSSKLCADDGTVASTGSITLDGGSVTTLFGTGYNPLGLAGVAPRASQPVARAQVSAGDFRAFDLRGATIPTANRRQIGPAAAVCMRISSVNGSGAIRVVQR